MKMTGKFRMPAEWETPTAILMAFPHSHTDWNYMLQAAIDQYIRIIKSLTDNDLKVVLLTPDVEHTLPYFRDINSDSLVFIEKDFNDTWMRDYGPITLVNTSKDSSKANVENNFLMLDFGFNGWGLKFAANLDNLINEKIKGTVIPDKAYCNHRDFILEGGSLETDGRFTLLTTSHCLLAPNRNDTLSKFEIEIELKKRLGCEKVIWLDNGYLEGDDTDGHIDTLARFTPSGGIIYCGPGNNDDDQKHSLELMREEIFSLRDKDGKPYETFELPLPDAIVSPEGERLPATYANYLVTDKVLFLPTYNQADNDSKAKLCLARAFPNHKIVGIDCRELIRQHGSLHCATMQIYNDIDF